MPQISLLTAQNTNIGANITANNGNTVIFVKSVMSDRTRLKKMATPNRGETVQKQIQQDWLNREYIEIITISIKKITDFLNSFDLSCRSKLAVLNEKLTILERKIDYLEACVTKGETLT